MKQKAMYILLAGILLLTACGGGRAEPTATIDANLIQTQAIETFSAALTQTALAAPTQTPAFTPTALPTFAPATTSAAITLPAVTQQSALISPTASCYQLRYVSDVSIQDNTQMAPGQSFTKTWRVRNTGSCAWEAGFKFAFVGGEQMSGATYTLPSAVPVNTEIDISIAMVAPAKTGTLRGNWRMQTAAGQFFGDEVFVQIVVGGGTMTPTNTTVPPTATTEAPTATTEPAPTTGP